MHQSQSADHGTAEKQVDALDQQRRAMLELEGCAGAARSFKTPSRPSECGQVTAAHSAPMIAAHSAFRRTRMRAPALGDDRRCELRHRDADCQEALPALALAGRAARLRESLEVSRSGSVVLKSSIPTDASSPRRSPDPAALLAWYDRHRRNLPWRAPPGIRPDPYRVWLSEIMLQQTTVGTVGPYFDRFVARWPDISALAAASLDEVLQLWQGLGYYARARNLHACARTIVERHGGVFPEEAEALRALPGIGDYTAAAIAAIAFDRREAAIDGNVERVVARLYAVHEALPAAKTRLQSTRRRAGSGPTGRRLRSGADGSRRNDLHAAPPALHPMPMAVLLRRRGVRPGRRIAGACREAGTAIAPRRRVLAHPTGWRGVAPPPPGEGSARRHDRNPLDSWRAAPWSLAEALRVAPATAAWSPLPGTVRHGFTHFLLELAVVAGVGTAEGIWSPIERLGDHALPTLMKKVARHAISALAVRSL